MVQAVSRTLQVDPINGKDQPGNSSTGPFKTLTAALRQVSGNTLIRLVPGTYSSESGEIFPLILPAGVTLNGDEANQGRAVVIRGGGVFRSAQWGDRNFAVVIQGNAQVLGVTVINSQGAGIGLESGKSFLKASQILQCSQDGVVVAGTAILAIQDCLLEAIGKNGLVFSQRSKGDVRRCIARRCDQGITVQDEAAPIISDSQCLSNRVGLGALNAARPVLRRTQLVQNQAAGLLMQQSAAPDIGQAQDPGRNVLRYNAQADVRNETSRPLISVGNDVLPQRLVGAVSLIASQIPDSVAVPSIIIGTGQFAQPAPSPKPPTPTNPVVLPLPPTPVTSSSRFSDVSGHWAAAYIRALADRGLIRGLADGTFQPNRAVTRAEFAALVVASFPSLPSIKPGTAFVDVPVDFWARDVISKAQQQGFLSGYPDQSFRPNESITRVQGMVAIANGLALTSAAASTLSVYSDRAQIPSYAVSAIAAATQNRLIINYPDPQQLRPHESLTRAEVSTLVYQGLVYQGKVPILDSSLIPRTAQVKPGFSDLGDHWAKPFIEALAQHNLIRGLDTGEFQPNAPMTRAQYAALLMKAFQPQAKLPPTSFTDVSPSFWAADAIQSAYRAGFLSGFPDYTFAPDHPLVRVQAWVSLVNGLGLLAGQPANLALLTRFVDRQNIPTYAQEAVAKATQMGLVVNSPEVQQLRPNNVASRADIAAAVYQALVQQQRMPAIASPYIVKP
ncbi:MAG TPA: S-layer homology domain-containing protein [Trichocoleus sp.]